ncbi:MAG: hypothetical protein ACXVJT_06195 [Thermoanaerobaculia bacterium]
MEEDKKSGAAEAIVELLVPLTVWAVGKALEHRPRKAPLSTRIARTARQVQRKAASNRMWIAAGAAICVVGISFIARAVKTKPPASKPPR